MESVIKQAIEAIQRNNNHRVSVYYEWSSETKTYYIDQIRIEAKSGMVAGYSGGTCVFELTPDQFSEYDHTGKTQKTDWIDHCPVHTRYKQID